MTTSPNRPINSSSSHSTPFQTQLSPSVHWQGTPQLSPLSTIEQASPTKALFQSRLNNDITSLTAWLEALHAPAPLPRRFLAWRDEVQQQSSLPSQLHLGILGHGYGQSGASTAAASADDGSKILEALKALKQANLLADHLRALMHEARAEELAALEGRMAEVVRQRGGEQEEGRRGVDAVYAELKPAAKVALEELADVAVLLQVALGEAGEGYRGGGNGGEGEVTQVESELVGLFSRQMLRCTQRRLRLDDQVERLRLLNCSMGLHPLSDGSIVVGDLTGLTKLSKELGVQALVAEDTGGMNTHYYKDEQIHTETANFTRDAKQINLKVLEYQERIAGLQRKLSRLRAETLSIEDVLKARKQVEQRAASVKELEQRIRVFHGLPPDLTASRVEIKRAVLELEEVRRKREDLFGKISSVER